MEYRWSSVDVLHEGVWYMNKHSKNQAEKWECFIAIHVLLYELESEGGFLRLIITTCYRWSNVEKHDLAGTIRQGGWQMLVDGDICYSRDISGGS